MTKKDKRYPQGRKRPKKPIKDPEANDTDWDFLNHRSKLKKIVDPSYCHLIKCPLYTNYQGENFCHRRGQCEHGATKPQEK